MAGLKIFNGIRTCVPNLKINNIYNNKTIITLLYIYYWYMPCVIVSPISTYYCAWYWCNCSPIGKYIAEKLTHSA